MNEITPAVKSWAVEGVRGWDRFWFTAVDPATLSLIRMLAGAMLLYTHLVWSLDLESFFSASGWLSPEAVHLYQQGTYAWSYFWWIDNPPLLWTVHIAALAVFAMLMLGLFTRVTSVLAFIAALAYVGRVPGALFGLDRINVMLAMYLVVGPAGARYSLDRLWRKRQGETVEVAPSISANVAIRLIQLHMCVIYLFAGTGKLTGTAWWDGTALWIALGNMEYQSLDMTWLADWPQLINLMTHVTIVWEVFYCALIWPRWTRPLMLALAVPLHLGIAVCLGMITFGLVMLIGNLAFVSPRLVRALLERRSAGQGGPVDDNTVNEPKLPHTATRQRKKSSR